MDEPLPGLAEMRRRVADERLRADINARSWIARTEAAEVERDALRVQIQRDEEAMGNLGAEVEHIGAERDRLAAENERLKGRVSDLEKDVECARKRCPGCYHCQGEYWDKDLFDELELAKTLGAENERLRQVAEAAKAYVARHGDYLRALLASEPDEELLRESERHQLVAAVDSYTQGKAGTDG